MSTGSDTGTDSGGLRAWLFRTDPRLLLVLAVGLYALFTVFSLLVGNTFSGTINTLRRISFLSAVYAMLVLALNLQWGYAGLFNLGVAGFMAIGVYTMGMLSTAPSGSPPGLGLPLPVGILGGVLAAALVGVVASLPALRLRGDYLAIVTLAFSEIIRRTYRSPVFESVTGGANGMQLPANPIRILFYQNPTEVLAEPNAVGSAVFGVAEGLGIRRPVVQGLAWTLVLVLVVAGIYALLRRVGNSPFGRVLKAIREDETVASALGKDTRGFKIKVFALGCGLMGLAAILWKIGGTASTVDYRPITTFYVFVALIIGGAGSNTGSVVGGAVFASLLLEGPRFVQRIVGTFVNTATAPNTIFQGIGALGGGDVGPLLAYVVSDVNISALRLVLLGVVLIYLIQNRPEGLLGTRKEVAASVDLADREGDR